VQNYIPTKVFVVYNCNWSQWRGSLRRGVCSYSLAGIVRSNPAGGMAVRLLGLFCAVTYRSIRRVDHLPRGVLPNMVGLSMIVKPR
jgi:hypothetical protein